MSQGHNTVKRINYKSTMRADTIERHETVVAKDLGDVEEPS